MAEALLEKVGEENFSSYPEVIDNYFIKNAIIVKTFPKEFLSVSEPEYPDFQVTSAQQFLDYLTQEIEFWTDNDPEGKLKDFSRITTLNNAKSYFESALSNISSCVNYLNQSISAISNGCLYSKTNLAKTLLTYKDKSSYFINGFKLCIQNKPGDSIPSNVGCIDGFFAAQAYKKVYQTYIECSEEQISPFTESVDLATKNLTELNARYTSSFHNHETLIAQLNEKVDDTISSIKTKEDEYFKDANTRLKAMEDLYREKLRLEAPAEYWQKLKKSYNKSGIAWIIISSIIAIGIIAFLILTLWKGESIFAKNADWIDNVKNSAILTVITSIGIYVLRLTTKMTLSSFHLSRDAKERENLSFFYLSLIEKGAVTDKERAIILNALFSRSDTGLLKGDSSPSMSSNISDLVEVFKNTKPN